MRALGETFAALCIGLFLIDWQKRTRPDRDERVSLGDVINCCLVGLVVGLVLDAEVAVVIAVLCGASMAAQIASPWLPVARRADPEKPAKQQARAAGPPALPQAGDAPAV